MTTNLLSVMIRSIASWDVMPDRFRPALLRRAKVEVGRRVLITSRTHFAKFGRISIADDVYINHGCFFDAEGDITIASHASIGDHVRFVTASHRIGPHGDRAGASYGGPIVVGAGSWIGSGVTILQGVTIGRGSIIAAGAVVTKDCEPNFLYAGVPAKKVRPLDVEVGSLGS